MKPKFTIIAEIYSTEDAPDGTSLPEGWYYVMTTAEYGPHDGPYHACGPHSSKEEACECADHNVGAFVMEVDKWLSKRRLN